MAILRHWTHFCIRHFPQILSKWFFIRNWTSQAVITLASQPQITHAFALGLSSVSKDSMKLGWCFEYALVHNHYMRRGRGRQGHSLDRLHLPNCLQVTPLRHCWDHSTGTLWWGWRASNRHSHRFSRRKACRRKLLCCSATSCCWKAPLSDLDVHY